MGIRSKRNQRHLLLRRTSYQPYKSSQENCSANAAGCGYADIFQGCLVLDFGHTIWGSSNYRKIVPEILTVTFPTATILVDGFHPLGDVLLRERQVWL
jgi:hypothetical protein